MFKTCFHVVLFLSITLFLLFSCAVDKEEIEVNNSKSQSIDNKITSNIDNEKQYKSSKEKEVSERKENKLTGDPDLGKKWFESQGCSTCHSTNEDTLIGPGLSNVFIRAKEHTMHNHHETHHETNIHTPEEYIEMSIRNPGEFVVDGFDDVYVVYDCL